MEIRKENKIQSPTRKDGTRSMFESGTEFKERLQKISRFDSCQFVPRNKHVLFMHNRKLLTLKWVSDREHG